MFGSTKKPVVPIPKVVCPYCSFELGKVPSRRQKCKSCGKEFVVRTHYLTKTKIVLTEKDAEKYDLEKEKYYLDKSLIDGLKLDINVDKDFVDRLVEKTREELSKRFGFPAALGDIAWSVANRMIIDAMKKGNLGLVQSIQFQMAIYLYDTGKNYMPVKANSFEIELRRYKKMDVKKVEIMATADSCDHCKVLNGQIFNIEEAIEKKILPCQQCTFQPNEKSSLGWCRCCYAPSIT